MVKHVAVLLSVALAGACRAGLPDTDWPEYLGTDANHHSPLDQITIDNVDELEVAWVYHTGGADPENRSQIQCNPLMVDGLLYGSTPQLEFFAIDAASGEERWRFDPFEMGATVRQGGANRGVTHWSSGREARLFVTGGAKLFALDPATGEPIPDFGDGGSIDLHDGLERDVEDLLVVSTTPGVIYEDLLIQPTGVAESMPAAPGHIRAFDVRTGEIVWTFHTIPHPGELGHDTWPPDAWRTAGGANNWAGMTIDTERGIVYVPTGSATPDFSGVDRPGANLFANTLLALDAASGERLWHFQAVHHDIWDRDFPAPPNLVTVERGGMRRDAVAQITKSAHVFLFNRETGDSLFTIEENPYPPSDIPGEPAWPTQPLPVSPPPFARQVFTEDEATDVSPESHRAVLDRLRRMRSDGQFIPASLEGTIILPGLDGGGEWGGAAVDPNTGMMYVNASEMAWIGAMVRIDPDDDRMAAAGHRVYALHCVQCHGVDRAGDALDVYPSLVGLADRMSSDDAAALIADGRGYMPSHRFLSDGDMRALIAYVFDSTEDGPYRNPTTLEPTTRTEYVFAGYRRFLDPDGYPAIRPPWGTLNAIDLNRGEIAWKVTLGEWPELTERGVPATGTENYGGPIVTDGGVIFIGATRDERFRAFDRETGALVWETTLPAAAFATPITYAAEGRQFVVIAAGGGKVGAPSGDAYVAFALPAP